MTEERFWEIVEDIGWPEAHYDVAKRRFMETHPKDTAVAFLTLFHRFKGKLYKQAGLTAISDSCDDNLAHIIGLGYAEYRRNMEAPHLVRTREERMDYKESFAYCIPFEEDYELLTDEGYERFILCATELIGKLDGTDPDDVAPRLYRRFPEIKEVCELLRTRRWHEGVAAYHRYFGEGYADDWPEHGYAIPNFVKTLENYRL